MKAFFEKLTAPGEIITTRDSVVRNVEHILCFGAFLDAGVDADTDTLSDDHNGPWSVVDVSLSHEQQIIQFQQYLAQLINVHEPRIKEVQVMTIKSRAEVSYCQLKICLYNEEFEQDFVFH
ncbi:hypothetical protein [Vibrio gazogenes]|uniref:Gene 25-like lysozyme n=1 Tax=Vibrio gazogenes DSM 21264 = NBRC 103151 TaxID=1123492 RepID=A0A1M4TF26_VIBGA|nr:hypothetical protein [Vibrio gazogenes]USP16081.1 hypothetical protein MKS89_16990 [Vibrio gazogenes]SHE43031.1 hypothetical protein SAMN02745781_00302 [Vibrio gazogenes DSM 21264] [Vibrio gazogenes DSM 21264 = NBRC 103151]SJN54243.1 hypothetical protein BQ6471_00902 [Vibrio gazogenes]